MNGTIEFSKIRDELLNDQEVQREYDSLHLSFHVAHEIISWRIRRGLTQQELAQIAGTRQSVISRVESGEHLPSLTLLKRLAEALGTSIHIKLVSDE